MNMRVGAAGPIALCFSVWLSGAAAAPSGSNPDSEEGGATPSIVQQASPVQTEPESPRPIPTSIPADNALADTVPIETDATPAPTAPATQQDAILAPKTEPAESALQSDADSPIPQVWAEVGGWDIAWYPLMQGCQAYALFERNTAFFIGFDKTGGVRSLNMTLIDKRWTQIEDGTEYKVQAQFGDNPLWDLVMDGRSIDAYPALTIHLSATASQTLMLTRQFRKESEMVWKLDGAPLARLSLSGSKRAFEAIQDCESSRVPRPPAGSEPPKSRPDVWPARPSTGPTRPRARPDADQIATGTPQSAPPFATGAHRAPPLRPGTPD